MSEECFMVNGKCDMENAQPLIWQAYVNVSPPSSVSMSQPLDKAYDTLLIDPTFFNITKIMFKVGRVSVQESCYRITKFLLNSAAL